MPPTDKLQTGLIAVYAELFATLRDQPVALLEIGIAQGGSLLHWHEFFTHPDTRIIGIDLQLPPIVLPPRVSMHECDQNDPRGLRAIAERHGPFNIIIDDGAHFARETRQCFDVFFGPALKTDGWYVIEDWAVGYWPDLRYAGMVELITDILHRVPALSISDLVISLKRGQAYAAFRKGTTGWHC